MPGLNDGLIPVFAKATFRSSFKLRMKEGCFVLIFKMTEFS